MEGVVSISSTSEEAKRLGHGSQIIARVFPLVQLPKKLKAQAGVVARAGNYVSISSTSEEAKSGSPEIGGSAKSFH